MQIYVFMQYEVSSKGFNEGHNWRETLIKLRLKGLKKIY